MYADTYWDDWNDSYNAYAGHDCANFASQCLKAGYLTLNKHWDYMTWKDHYDNKGCWKTVIGLDDQLYWGHVAWGDGNYAYDDGYGQDFVSRSWMAMGDVVLFGYDPDDPRWEEGDYFEHATFVTEGTGSGIKMNAHTNDRWHKSLSWFHSSFSSAIYYHVASYASKPVMEAKSTPAIFTIGSNYPNPFNSSTVIPFTLKNSGHIRLEVLNVSGQTVRTLVDEVRTKGSYHEIWNGKDEMGRDAATGIYFYQLQIGNASVQKKLILLR